MLTEAGEARIADAEKWVEEIEQTVLRRDSSYSARSASTGLTDAARRAGM